MKVLTVTSPDDRLTTYESFISMEEVKFGEYTFIRIVRSGEEIFINPARIKSMVVSEA